ncbi:MAG TPA: hypothetical protein VHG29_14065 [Novosphingobium sp.]|nr:hypothetical protein [Novosphingobium sp.]
MSTEAEIAAPPARRTILLLTLCAVAAALLILFAAVLPAEYNRDPTGLGRLTGIARLWAPEEQKIGGAITGAPASRSYPVPFRSDIVEIQLATGDDTNGGNELEYKVHLEKGASYVYSWSVSGVSDPEEFYTEFHGHTVTNGKSMTVAEYRKATGASDNGVLTAPFTGIHGWYFQNQSVPAVKITLRLAGFYTLIPAGQPGNEKGLGARQLAP